MPQKTLDHRIYLIGNLELVEVTRTDGPTVTTFGRRSDIRCGGLSGVVAAKWRAGTLHARSSTRVKPEGSPNGVDGYVSVASILFSTVSTSRRSEVGRNR